MKIETNKASKTEAKSQYFLTAEAILKYLMGTNERIVTMITCKDVNTELVTTDFELYQAFGSLKDYDNIAKAKLVKLLETVDIVSHRRERKQDKKILTHERVEQLRSLALKDNGEEKNE